MQLATVLTLCIALVVSGAAAMAAKTAAVVHDQRGHQTMSLVHAAGNQMAVIDVHAATHASQSETHVLPGSDCHTALCCRIDAKYNGVFNFTYDPHQSVSIEALLSWSRSPTLSAPDRPPRFS